MPNWTRCRKFPNAKKREMLTAPIGPGVYELRLGKRLVLVGIGRCCAYRMTSLLPTEAGTRNNSHKKKFVSQHIGHVQYRTMACSSRNQAKKMEHQLLGENQYEFQT